MKEPFKSDSKTKIVCYHCGDDCLSDSIISENKNFCCNGCKTVFEILSNSNLSEYYSLENKPGISMKSKSAQRFDYLDDDEVFENLLEYKDESIAKIQFSLPQIHCSACIWLLENLYQLNPAIESSRVNFLKKEAYVTFDYHAISLKQLVQLLGSLGYEPKISLNDLETEKQNPLSKKLLYQVGLAGFAFGNIMLMSLPEYFGLDEDSYRSFSSWFGWINLGLATPVMIFSGQDYFKSAWKSIQIKRLNIDVPIALGVFVLYSRSFYEIVSQTGAGFFDSLCGLLFFLLLGRIFQEKIYHQLSFERDYRSYFPISVTKLENGIEKNIPINNIKKGDKILIRNGELIPVDALLIKGKARIDNSFATGEAIPIKKELGEKIYAGGRQVGEAIQMEVIRPLNQSKLTRLWSDYAEKKKKSATFSAMTDRISQYFTPIILMIAFAAGFYHFQFGLGKSIEVVSAVLIVACPCALALAAPFTFGHASRWLGKNDCYLRETNVIEDMAKINHIVFDKTGTITYSQNQKVNYSGKNLSQHELLLLWNLVSQSNHPLSRLIKENIEIQSMMPIEDYVDKEGYGIQATIDNSAIRLGSANWFEIKGSDNKNTKTFVEVDGEILGHFSFENKYRNGLSKLLNQLKRKFAISLVSGDNSNQEEKLKKLFPQKSIVLFNQKPEQKIDLVKLLQKNHTQVMMVGDGLNDAGALRQANVGVAIAENINGFSPACDVILGASQFAKLGHFLNFAKQSRKIVIISFIISFLYNGLGLSLAVQGLLSPVFAAILMPISSISVVSFVSLAVWFKSTQLKNRRGV